MHRRSWVEHWTVLFCCMNNLNFTLFFPGMQMCEKVALSKPLRSLGSRPLKTLIPGCEKYASEEEKYFRCQLRTVLISAHHSVGSVKMGDPSDPTTVLDSKLR